MTEEIKYIVYMEISKSKAYEPTFYNYAIEYVNTKSKDAYERLNIAILNNSIPENTRKMRVEENDLSFELYSEKALYAIKFASHSQKNGDGVRFGPGMAPITFIGSKEFFGFDVISNVRLFYKSADEKIYAIDAVDIPKKYDEMPENSWAVFECDTGPCISMIRENRSKSYSKVSHSHSIKIPFYLNIYDEESKFPIWYGEGISTKHDGYHPGTTACYAILHASP